MLFIKRSIEKELMRYAERGKSILLLGPRQCGKTSLIGEKIKVDLELSFLQRKNKLRYEKNPELLIKELELLQKKLGKIPLVFIDEIQKIPVLMDEIQYAIDKKIAVFVLTGSSARKLKKQNEDINLLPGRIVSLRLDPFSSVELSDVELNDLLIYGSLPEIILDEDVKFREDLLESYVQTYLEEEIRMEALVRDVGVFNRFLEFAGIESGQIVNFSSISQEIGVAHTTIQSYFQILVDTLVAERIEPLTSSSTRKRLVKSARYLLFDLGVRRICAREGAMQSTKRMGQLFEHFIGLELVRAARNKSNKIKIRFWKDLNGPEVDWVVDGPDLLIPIEVKWTEKPSMHDAVHLETFLGEYKNAKHGYIVCRTPNEMQISKNITAIPWRQLIEKVITF